MSAAGSMAACVPSEAVRVGPIRPDFRFNGTTFR